MIKKSLGQSSSVIANDIQLENKVIRGAKWAVIGAWSRKLTSFIVFLILARLIHPESMGLVALATVYIGFADMFSRQGVGDAIVQAKELRDSFLDCAYLLNMVSAMVVTLFTCLFSEQISSMLGDENLNLIVIVLSISILMNGLVIVPVAIQVREFENKKIANQMFGSSFISGVVAIPLAYLGYEVWALVAQTLSASLSYYILILLNSKWKCRLKFNFPEFKYLFVFSIKMLATTTAFFTRERAAILVVGWLYGPVGIGYYSIAYRFLVTVRSLVVDPIERITMPTLSKIIDHPQKLNDGLAKICTMNSIISIPVFIGLASVSDEFIPIAFGENWNPVIPIMRMLSLSFLSLASFFYFWPLFVASGKPGLGAWFHLTHAACIVPLIYLGSYKGMEGIACGVFLGSLTASFIWLYVVNKLFGLSMSLPLKIIVAPLSSGLIMALMIYLIKQVLYSIALNQLFILLVCIILGAIFYILSLRVISKKAYEAFIEVVMKLKRKKANLN